MIWVIWFIGNLVSDAHKNCKQNLVLNLILNAYDYLDKHLSFISFFVVSLNNCTFLSFLNADSFHMLKI